ncbi:rho GTPase-activating protein 9-like [Pipra filicauda]|uniref:Rho GTPase-activating protein 9-like n=1 Tax=Pipra filicauda TaxID=649802 RepID=A0A7R5KJY0_9PASS|nr:rho GTPase-activating protein 9-like [Pipra filicauda]
MLPGRRWRRAGPAVPLRALFGYRYRAENGREVAMAAGERLLLLRRATPDWWQVRRPGDPPWARPFFVPAAYVAEEEPGDSGTRSPRTPGQPAGTGGWGLGGRQCCSPEDLCAPSASPPRTVGTGTGQLAGGVTPTPAQCQSQQDTGVSPPGPTTISRNPDGLQREGRGAAPPVPAGPPLQVLGSWERHRDPESGRCFFYSPESGTSSWKPPRLHRDRQVIHGGSLAHHSPEDWGADLAQEAAPQEQHGFMGGCPGLNPDPTEQEEGPPGSADHKQAFFVSTKPVNRCPLK